MAILYLCYHRSPQTTPISEFGHVDASFIITNQFLTSKYSYISIFIEIGDHWQFDDQRWISIRNIIIYLETKFRPNRRIFVFWLPFWIQNGRHSKQKWSRYGASCLTSCKYQFPLKSFHFWIFNDFFYFYISGHFENSKTWMHLLRWGSTFLWSLVKIGISVYENLVGQNRGEKKSRNNNNNNNNNNNYN